jgi:hypothetical protein
MPATVLEFIPVRKPNAIKMAGVRERLAEFLEKWF